MILLYMYFIKMSMKYMSGPIQLPTKAVVTSKEGPGIKITFWLLKQKKMHTKINKFTVNKLITQSSR